MTVNLPMSAILGLAEVGASEKDKCDEGNGLGSFGQLTNAERESR
jgi:hypothetical protein